jgi:PAS domain S-box-containing protein
MRLIARTRTVDACARLFPRSLQPISVCDDSQGAAHGQQTGRCVPMSMPSDQASPTPPDASPTRNTPASIMPRASGRLPEGLSDTPGQTSEIFAIFRDPDLLLTYINATGWQRIDRQFDLELDTFTLNDLIGVSSREVFVSTILPSARIMGRWEGICELRDAWGSSFSAHVQLFTRHATERAHTTYLCLAAVPTDPQQGRASLSDREFLHMIMTSLPDSLYFKDKASRYLLINRTKALRHGLSDPREAIGKTDFDYFRTEHATPAFQEEQRIIKTGEPIIDKEQELTWADGHRTWVATSKMPLRNSEGEVVGTFGVSRDITASKKLAKDRRELELQLQLNSKLESIGRLAAGIAHEINTPTQYLSTNIRFLDESFPVLARVFHAHRAFRDVIAASPFASDPAIATALTTLTQADSDSDLPYLLGEIPETLKQSLEGLAHVARIVRSLKEFSHPGSATKVPVDLNKIAENALTVSRHEWKYVAEVSTDFAADLDPVPCIADQIGQVILNLVVNAAHAIGDTLKSRNRERGRITVRTLKSATHAIVEIQDDGTGIPDDVRARLFEPFFTTKAVGKGTGQGLALVRTIVETNHRGVIELETAVGTGSTFRLSFPYEAAPDITPAGVAMPEGPIAPP